MPYFEVIFYNNNNNEHKVIPLTEQDYQWRIKENMPLVNFGILHGHSNNITEILVTVQAFKEEWAVSEAVFKLIKHIEDNLSKEAETKEKMKFYKALTGRIPYARYTGINNEIF